MNIKITFPNFGHFIILIRLAELEIGAAGRDPIADFHSTQRLTFTWKIVIFLQFLPISSIFYKFYYTSFCSPSVWPERATPRRDLMSSFETSMVAKFFWVRFQRNCVLDLLLKTVLERCRPIPVRRVIYFLIFIKLRTKVPLLQSTDWFLNVLLPQQRLLCVLKFKYYKVDNGCK